MGAITEFIVKKDDISQGEFIERPAPDLKDGEICAKVDSFAFTANNVTYGVVGERIGYWKFFPVEREGWGIIPVWGFADVVESKSPDVAVGERLYGYWPMGSHLVMSPAKVKENRLVDGAAHRAELPPVYNSYARVKAEEGYDPSFDPDRMVLYPLYATSYCLYDFCKDNDWFGAEQVVIPSASSKTAIGLAYAIKEDGAKKQIGLTSPRNAEAVKALGLYDEVVVYDDIETAVADAPTVIVDMSGNGDVLGRLHKHLGDNMKYTSNVGVTHYDANAMGADFIRERSAMFFAPGHIQKRASDWGPGVFESKAFAFWRDAAERSRSWLTIKTGTGPDAVRAAYDDVLEGKTPAKESWALSF